MVQPSGSGWPRPNLDGRAGGSWRRREVWPELRPAGHQRKKKKEEKKKIFFYRKS